MNYDRAAISSIRALKSAGRVLAVNRYGSTFDEETSTTTRELVSSSEAFVVLIPAKEGKDPFAGFDETYAEALRLGKLRKVLISPDIAVAPSAGDEIEADGSVWVIKAITPLSPAGIVVLYQGIAEASKPYTP